MTDPLRPATRVLVIDDSVLVRRVVRRAFEHERTIDLVGAVRNGRAVLGKVEALRPDVVVLDSVVAASDGFPTLSEIRRRQPQLRAVIFSQLATRRPDESVPRATAGMTRFAPNPAPDGIGLTEEHVRNELLPLIGDAGSPAGRAPTAMPVDPDMGVDRGGPAAAIVIAVSTGGPDALAAVVGRLPADLPVPILVVQHMPAEFTKLLANRLDRESALRAVEASAGQDVLPGVVYVAPGGRHMAVTRAGGRISVALHDGPPENSCRPAADVLFRSAAEVYRQSLIAVVLTGMGQDGLRGAAAVRHAGGLVIAQSESSAVAIGMPGAVAAAGLTDAIVPLEELGEALTDQVLHGSLI
jgi:two-component system chemotaxis response regulator CheB